ncbi:MAG: QVPTGV class sortase B protein-sorting domain-containing protein [Lachnospiraceae bacterium]|nr:QVPTGV class sortase B protein-sorting domain-containing protein [Lachnospiraceae bacterium]
MKGKTKKVLTFLVTSVLAVLMMASVAGATANYTAVTGTSTTFTKYLVVPSDANIPNKTFNFSIAAGTAVVGSTDSMPIYAGDDAARVTGTPTIAADQAAFVSTDTTTAGAANDGIANDIGKKYASKTVTIDFSSVSYKEPGVYRYVVTEDTTAPTGVNFDTQVNRTLDVNVIDDGGTLKIDSYVMYYGEVTSAQSKTDVKADTDTKKAKASGIKVGDKCNSYVNSYPSQNLYVGKKIDGNQASKDKYFRFTVKITGAGSGTVINVGGDYTTAAIAKDVNGATTITDADLAGADTYTNPGTITADANEEATAVFYLQGDQYVNLMGIPTGAVYIVTEDDYSSDGYVSTAASSTASFTIGTDPNTLTFDDATTGTVADGEDVYTGYKNVKQGVIPTGVILSVAPWIIAGIVVIAGVVFFAIRSRKKYEEE